MVLKRDELDATDWKILALLQKDARVTYQEIGRAVGLTRPAARERVLRILRALIAVLLALAAVCTLQGMM